MSFSATAMWAGVATVLVAAIVAAVASAAPVAVDPAVEDPADAELSGKLATTSQLETVSEGSTTGFATDALLVPDPAITPGATGWWSTDGLKDSDYTVDSCGSDFTAELTAYGRVPRTSDYKLLDATADGCADPLRGTYASSIGLVGPELIRIDDATGMGGKYTVSYRRTAIPASVEITKVRVGKVERIERRRRKGKAKVTVRVRTAGESGIKTRCKLDGRRAVESCAGGVTFKNVRSGTHTVKVTASNAYGKGSDEAEFRVPRRK